MEPEKKVSIELTENFNVLYIAYYFPPMGLSGVQRTLKFTKYLPEYKWNPLVLTADSYDYYAYDEALLDELPTDLQVFRTPTSKKQSKVTRKFPNYFIQKLGRIFLSWFYQPDSKIKWIKSALELGSKIINDYKINAILATAPPFTDFLTAYQLSQKHDLPFIVDYRDTWVDNPFHYYPTPFHKGHNINLEKKILTHADKVIVTTRFSKETLLRRYRFLTHEDIVIIPHGFDQKDFNLHSDVRTNPNKFVITHSGLFQDNRTPKYFLKALSLFLIKNKDAKELLEVRFVGLMRKNHLKLIKKYNFEKNCICTGYVTHTESVRHLLESDILWLMMKDVVRSPGKLYEYFGARKPIFINCPKGNMLQLALDTKAAFANEPEDVKGILSNLQKMFELWQNGKLPKPDENYIKSFDRKKLTSELARELSLILKY
jgi:glycosyltransferase involved in cell wall biosynthesis